MATSTGLPSLIPLEVLFGNPERAGAQISPDGKRMAYLAPVNGVLNVWVGDVGADNYRPVTADTDRGIRVYAFAHDNIHVIYLQDTAGDENWRVFDVNLETNEMRDLTPFEGVQAQILGMSKRFPNEVLVGLNKDNRALHDVYHLELQSGELKKVLENPGFMVLPGLGSYVVDYDLKVRGATKPRPDGGLQILVRDSEDGEWKSAVEFDLDDTLASQILRFTKDGQGLFLISSQETDKSRLVKLAITTKKSEVLAEDADYDITQVLFHQDSWEPQLASVLRHRLEWKVLDSSIDVDIKTLLDLHPGEMAISGRDHADKTWLVAYSPDDGSPAFYSYDRSKRQATFLFEAKPKLSGYTLVKLEPLAYKSRDGLSIEGYLTFPTGVERKNLPTVLLPHGGPWARDFPGYNPLVQWLVNRGYLVVQPNFRGSTGYGKSFLNAGDLEWGAKMHDDLIDAVDYVIAQGLSDPKRIAILGGSYGGYSALVGATFTPDVFCCAVAIVGPSNLITFLESIPPYWEPMRALWNKRMGEDKDFLWSRSPLAKVDNIKIPMLVVQGANDPRVVQAESEQIVAAMKEKGIDHEYLLFPDEGHGFAKPENWIRFASAAEKFLAKHAGGRAELPERS